MWTLRIATLVTVAAAILTWIAQAYINGRYNEGTLGGLGLFTMAHPVSKLGMMLLFLMGIMLVISAFIGLLTRRPTHFTGKITVFEGVVIVSALAPIALSILLAAYTEMGIAAAIQEMGLVRFEIIAPQKQEQLFTLGLGLWPAAIAFVLLLVARRLQAKKR